MPTLKHFIFLPLLFCCVNVFAQEFTTIEGEAEKTNNSNFQYIGMQTVKLKYDEFRDCDFFPDGPNGKSVHIRLINHETKYRDNGNYWDVYISDNYFDAGYGQYKFKICTAHGYEAFEVEDTKLRITYAVKLAKRYLVERIPVYRDTIPLNISDTMPKIIYGQPPQPLYKKYRPLPFWLVYPLLRRGGIR